MAAAIRDPRDTWATLSQEARDLAYNNNAAVPDCTALNAARVEASRLFRAAHAATLDLPYGPKERQAWDLYPAQVTDAPCLVFIHGGYWQRNQRQDFACLAEGVLQHGWSCAMPGYSLAPEANLGEIVGEISLALDWLARHRAGEGMTGPVIVSGWSAGAHLAAMALGHPLVAAGLAISGVFELGPIRDTFLNAALRLSEAEIEALSPLRLPPMAKPLTIAYGTREVPALIVDSRTLHAHRAAVHAPGPLLPVAEANHFTILHTLRSPKGALTRAALRLVEDLGVARDFTE